MAPAEDLPTARRPCRCGRSTPPTPPGS